VNFTVTQRAAVLVGAQLGCQREETEITTLRAQQLLHGSAGAGPGVTHVETLALEIVEALDVGFLAGDDREGLWMQGEYRAEFLELAGILELAFTVVRIEADVRLNDAQVQFTGLD